MTYAEFLKEYERIKELVFEYLDKTQPYWYRDEVKGLLFFENKIETYNHDDRDDSETFSVPLSILDGMGQAVENYKIEQAKIKVEHEVQQKIDREKNERALLKSLKKKYNEDVNEDVEDDAWVKGAQIP